jgi:hypothetical protein
MSARTKQTNDRAIAPRRIQRLNSLISMAVFASALHGGGVPAQQSPTAAKNMPPGNGPCTQPALLQKALVPQIDTDQTTLNNIVLKNGMTANQASGYSFKTILINGRHLFTTPFTEPDGAGEGTRSASGDGLL